MSDIFAPGQRPGEEVISHVERVAGFLEAQIVSGALGPGSRVGEEQLSAAVSSSRGVVREALRKLEGRGLVVRMPHAGVRVVKLSREDAGHLYSLRRDLESAACRYAARTLDAQDLDALDMLLDRHASSPNVLSGDNYRQRAGSEDFHYRIAAGCGNPYLTRLLCSDLYSLIRLVRFQLSAMPGRARDALADHRAIVAALRKRDGELAALLMDRHLSWAIGIIDDTTEPWFLPANAKG